MKKLILILFIICNALLISAQSRQSPPSTQKSNKMEVDQYSNITKLAYTAMANADYNAAIKYLTSAIEKSEYVYYYYNRAICYNALGRYKEALDDYYKTLTLDDMPESYYGIGLIDLKLDKFAEAIPYFSRALMLSDSLLSGKGIAPERISAIEKNKADIFINLAVSYKNNGDDDNAVKNFTQSVAAFSTLIKGDPNNDYYLLQRAACYSELNQTQNAIADYSTIIKFKTIISFEAYYERAKQYIILEDYGKAIEDLTTVLKNDPKNTTALFYRASCQLHLEKYENACADFKNAVKNGFKDSADYKQIMADNPKLLEEFVDCK